MCGITGFIDFDNKPQPRTLKRMLQAISYRGPDSHGMFTTPIAALGINRLKIIDLSTGDQPISNENGTVTIVFNGEIYNYQELRKELIEKKHRFKTQTDTEVLVHLYEELGTEFLTKLNGMFVCAIWDEKRKQLVLARDHAGIKPLYYYSQGNTLIFGSEPKVILAHPNYQKRLNQSGIASYATFGYVAETESMYKGIYKLPAASFLIFSKQGNKVRRYRVLKKNNQAVGLSNLLFDSLKGQIIADVPLGIFLSGGIDSSLITYYAQLNTNKVLKTFSIGFVEPSFDESRYSKIVSEYLHTDHRHRMFTALDVKRAFPKIVSLLDEPLADPSLFPTYLLSKFTRNYVTVALSGDGGDELFGGYPTYQAHLWAQQLHFLPQSLANAFVFFISRVPASQRNLPLSDMMSLFFSGYHLPALKRHYYWMNALCGGVGHMLRSSVSSPMIEELQQETLSSTTLDFQKIDYQTYLRDDLLVKTDRASMYNSLEVRVPFLDPRIIAYAFGLPASIHVDKWQTKKVLRRLAAPLLPESIVNRRKKGFGIPVSGWINNELRELVDQELKNDRLYEFFDRAEVESMVNKHRLKKHNFGKQIWTLVMLGAWLKKWGA